MCEKYVPLALKHLSGLQLRDASTPRTFDGPAERYRLIFLFPGTSEKVFASLSEMRHIRWLLENVQAEDTEVRSIRSGHNAEQLHARYEIQKKEIESFLPHLTAVQQEIVAEYFFKVKGA